MDDTPTLADELHRKALDQVAQLLAQYDAGLIGPEAARVGVETIWACLSGIVRTQEFQDLIHDANLWVQDLPVTPTGHVWLTTHDTIIGVIRLNEKVTTFGAAKPQTKEFVFDTVNEAADKERQIVEKLTEHWKKELGT